VFTEYYALYKANLQVWALDLIAATREFMEESKCMEWIK
jgi:hypothetical protein